MSCRVEFNILFNSYVMCYRNFFYLHIKYTEHIMTRHDTTRHDTERCSRKPTLLLCRVHYITFGIRLSNLILGYEQTSVLRRTLFFVSECYEYIIQSEKWKSRYWDSDFRVREPGRFRAVRCSWVCNIMVSLINKKYVYKI